jgi:hypothetical protein
MWDSNLWDAAPSEAVFPVAVSVGLEVEDLDGDREGEVEGKTDRTLAQTPENALKYFGPFLKDNGVVGAALAAYSWGGVVALSAPVMFTYLLAALSRVRSLGSGGSLEKEGSVFLETRDLEKYKTRMCKQYLTSRACSASSATPVCSYGSSCLFAHGQHELRDSIHSAKAYCDREWLLSGMVSLAKASNVLDSVLYAAPVLFAGRPMLGPRMRSKDGGGSARRVDDDDAYDTSLFPVEDESLFDFGYLSGSYQNPVVEEEESSSFPFDNPHVKKATCQVRGATLGASSFEEWKGMAEGLTRRIDALRESVVPEEKDAYEAWSRKTKQVLDALVAARDGYYDAKFWEDMVFIENNEEQTSWRIGGWMVQLLYKTAEGHVLPPEAWVPLESIPGLSFQMPFVYCGRTLWFQMGCEMAAVKKTEDVLTYTPGFAFAVGARRRDATVAPVL